MRRFLLAGAAVSCAALAGSCKLDAPPEVAGPAEPMTFSRQNAEWLATPTSSGVVRDPLAEQYLSGIVARLWAGSGETSAPPDVMIVPDRSVGANAMGNRTIYVSYGLLEQAKNEDTIAGLLAHESGHIHLDHFAKNPWFDGFHKALDAGFIALAFFGPSAHGGAQLAHSTLGGLLGEMMLRKVSPNTFQTAWSREAESQADSFAVDTLVAAGYRWDGLVQGINLTPDVEKPSIFDGAVVIGDTPQGRHIGINPQQLIVNLFAGTDHPAKDDRREAIRGYYNEKYPTDSAPKGSEEALKSFKRQDAAFFSAMTNLMDANEALTAALDSKKPQQDPKAISTALQSVQKIYPEYFGAAPAAPRAGNRNAVIEAAPGGVQDSYFARTVAMKAVAVRNQPQQAVQIFQALVSDPAVPMDVLSSSALDDLERGQYADAVSDLNLAEQRFGDQERLYPLMVWGYAGLAKSTDQKIATPAKLELAKYQVKCMLTLDLQGTFMACAQAKAKVG